MNPVDDLGPMPSAGNLFAAPDEPQDDDDADESDLAPFEYELVD